MLSRGYASRWRHWQSQPLADLGLQRDYDLGGAVEERFRMFSPLAERSVVMREPGAFLTITPCSTARSSSSLQTRNPLTMKNIKLRLPKGRSEVCTTPAPGRDCQDGFPTF